jgi:hypothetical protein
MQSAFGYALLRGTLSAASIQAARRWLPYFFAASALMSRVDFYNGIFFLDSIY